MDQEKGDTELPAFGYRVQGQVGSRYLYLIIAPSNARAL